VFAVAAGISPWTPSSAEFMTPARQTTDVGSAQRLADCF
jgi:hypothetical protein